MITNPNWEESLGQAIECILLMKEEDGYDFVPVLVNTQGEAIHPDEAWDIHDYMNIMQNEMIQRKRAEYKLAMEDGFPAALRTLYLKTTEIKFTDLEEKFLDVCGSCGPRLQEKIFFAVVRDERNRIENEELERLHKLRAKKEGPLSEKFPHLLFGFEKMLE